MNLTISKTDLWCAAIAGEAIALLSLPVLKNLSVFNSLFLKVDGWAYALILLWLLIVPAGSALGIEIAVRLVPRYKGIFELAKYGVVGWLNVFVNIGAFNFLSWIFGVARGFVADIFIVIAFMITITNAFFWNKSWTFGAKSSGEGKKEYTLFFVVTGLTTVLNALLFHVVVNVFGAPAGMDEKVWANIAILFSIPISFIGNFFGYKIFVFKKKPAE